MNYIKYSVSKRIAFITLNRAEKRNALNFEVVTELIKAFTSAKDDANVKIIILKAEGMVFCAGADLTYIQQLQKNTYEENLEDSSHLKDLFYLIYTMDKVVISQINGHAIAGGCGLAAVTDFSFAVPEAKFGYTEVKIGFVPAIVSVFLLRKIGGGKTKELLLTGTLFEASKAVSYGLINWVVAADELGQKVLEFANQLISDNSAQSMAMTKKMIHEFQPLSLEYSLELAVQKNAKARETEDCKKGISAFLNKEKVKW